MQNEKAQNLRNNWNGKPCKHTKLEKEYFLGSDSGDYVCSQCGEVFTKTQKENLEKN